MPGIKKKWIKANNKENSDDKPEDGSPELSKEETSEEAPKKESKKPPSDGMLKGLDGEVLLEKRKRFVPAAELKLNEWLESNLEKRTEVTLPVHQLYEYYTLGQMWNVLDLPDFKKVLKAKFGPAFGLTESSVLKGVLKERKLNKEKKKRLPGSISLKDAVFEAIQHFGNPTQGVRFFSLKQFIGFSHPALQVDTKPKMLKRTLERCVGFGQLDLVKGIGMAGFYRAPGDDDSETKKKQEKETDKKDEDNTKKDAEANGDKEEKADTEKDEKSQEGSAEGKENKDDKEPQSDKKKEKKPVQYKPVKYSELCHDNPDKLEDTFPLAITYQSAPKIAGLTKIRKYIATKYREEVTDNKWRQVIEKGVQNGSWEHISGSGMSGSIHLLMDDFDPSSSVLDDQICAAVIACHEPKSASANQIKKYVSKYHPDFKVDERPQRFKKALLRAISKNLIVQVTGLGANGSFQLTAPFVPSPEVLAGEEEEEDEDSDDSDEDNEPKYIPKGTKSRGRPTLKKAEPIPASSGRGRGRPAASGKSKRGRPVAKKSYKAEESSDEENVPAKKRKSSPAKKETPSKRGRPAKTPASGKKDAPVKKGPSPKKGKSPSKPKKRDLSPLSDEEEEDDLDMVEYTPRKSKSRGGSAPTPAQASRKDKAKPGKDQKGRGRPPAKKRKQEESDADDEDDDEEDTPEYTPRKSKSRGGVTVTPSSKKETPKGRKKSKK